MTNYVLGFAFSEDKKFIVLLEKVNPPWQAGKLNAVGGKVEKIDDTLKHAIEREFREETGVKISHEQWADFAILKLKDATVYCFKTFTDKINKVESTTTEEVRIYDIELFLNNPDSFNFIPNLGYLIRMALDDNLKFTEIKYFK
jgi:8-oxo-dGTP diphosphatase